MNLSSFDPLVLSVLAAVVGYLIGSLSFAVIVSRLFGLADPRSYGSGNPGATNVLRSGNKGAAILTLVFDALKGYVPVLVALQLGLSETVVTLVGLGAFIGHLWPVFFKFEGGKGVATALGVLVGISPWLGLCAALTWLVVALVSRYSSLASLSSALVAPLVYVLAGGMLWSTDRVTVVAIIAMSALLAWRHQENISRLVQGKESRLGKSKEVAATAAVPVSANRKRRKRH